MERRSNAFSYRLSPVLKPRTIRYGPHHSNVGDLWLPVGTSGQLPVVVLIHGGFWRAAYTKRLMNGLARDAVERGWAAWNVEYRRVGLLGGGGGWPTTLLDVGAALDHLAMMEDVIDITRVVTCGHSAGGQLALWAAGRARLPAGSPGSEVAVSVRGAVSLSGVVDLEDADRLGLGAQATAKFVGGHWNEYPDRYRHASPRALLPLGVAQILIHAGNDSVVPSSMSRDYQTEAARKGDSARYLLVDGIGHRQLIDPRGLGWATAVSELTSILA
jgi:acetyl esterase/lipase